MKKKWTGFLTGILLLGCADKGFAAGLFSEVPLDDWSYGAVNQLIEAGVLNYGNESGVKKGISRYEMAILVAKAAAKENAVSLEQKNVIQKLETEYQDELKDLGVIENRILKADSGVQKEKKKERIETFGYIGFRNEATGNNGSGCTQKQIPSLRSTHFEIFNTFHATDNIDVDLETVWDKRFDIPYENFQAARMLYLTGRINKTNTIKVGRFDHTPVYGVVYNERLAGIQYNFGLGKTRVGLSYGRNVSYSASVYSQNEDVYQDWTAGGIWDENHLRPLRTIEVVYSPNKNTNIKTAYTDWTYNSEKFTELGADVLIGKDWLLKGEIAKSNFGTYNKGYYAELRYKAANPFKPGSYTIYTAYRNIPAEATIDPINRYDLDFSYDFRGWTIGTEITVGFKQALCASYMWGKKPSDATSTHVMRVQYSVLL